MRMGRSTTGVPINLCESNEEARAALWRVVRATRADLADMDRLLDRAERLVSGASRASRSGSFAVEASQQVRLEGHRLVRPKRIDIPAPARRKGEQFSKAGRPGTTS